MLFRCVFVFLLVPGTFAACDVSLSAPDPYLVVGRDASFLIDDLDAGTGVDPATGLRFIDTGTGEPESPLGRPARNQNATVRPCPSGCGIQQQIDDQWSNCVAGAERCNNHDDDCDNQADEDFSVGVLCSAAQANGCTAEGQLVCSANGVSVDCQAPSVTPVPETCDGFDNDCDGSPDEDYPGQLCCTQDYQCPGGGRCNSGQCDEPPRSTGGGNGGGDEPFLSTPVGGACNGNIECQSVACINNVCVTTCFDDTDCQNGEVCAPADPAGLSGLDALFPPDICQQGNGRGTSANATPPRDNGGVAANGNPESCLNAMEIEGLGSYQSSTMNASSDIDAECGNGGVGPERVFAFRAARSGTIVVDTNGSDFDTVLSIRTQCEVPGTEIGCDDDSGDGTQSLLPFDVQPNTVYFIVVHGFGRNARGQINLNVREFRGN